MEAVITTGQFKYSLSSLVNTCDYGPVRLKVDMPI